MSLFSIIKISIDSIISNRARAILTTLGIVIGISAVITMLSLGQGAQSSILEEVQGLGSNTITVIPLSGGFGNFQSQGSLQRFLTNNLDYDVVNKLNNEVKFREIEAVSPEINSSYEVSYRSQTEFLSVYGITEEFFTVRTVETIVGRKFTVEDDLGLRKVAILGPDSARKLFGESDPIGNSVKVDGLNFTVIGITESKNSNYDDRVYIPYNSAAFLLIGERNPNQIAVKVNDAELLDSVAVKIESELMEFYRVEDEEDATFTVITSNDIISLTSSITSIFTALLASIASISLVVGGIGIMNIMLVSVTERTKEIGLRKAIGAKESAIRQQFLIEAVVLTLVGGFIGITLGIFFGIFLGSLANIPAQISWQSILLATSVSAIIGLVFGYYPAYRASKLNPIDALRYE